MSDASIVTGAMCAALTGLGGVLAFRAAQQGAYLRATRWVGLALIPIGLYLTGLATLARRVGSALTDWATDLAFGVRAWAGVAVLAVAISLLILVRAVNARRSGAAAEPPAVSGSSGRLLAAATGQRSARPATAKPAKRSRRDDTGLGGEFAEIEEILKRRGI